MKELLNVLQSIEKPGDFCTFGTIEPCFPGLEITHLGSIGLPLNEIQAKKSFNNAHKHHLAAVSRQL